MVDTTLQELQCQPSESGTLNLDNWINLVQDKRHQVESFKFKNSWCLTLLNILWPGSFLSLWKHL